MREKERSLKITQQIHELRNLLSSGGVIVPKVRPVLGRNSYCLSTSVFLFSAWLVGWLLWCLTKCHPCF